MNKSALCYMCEKKGKIPIYYRDKQNVHKVAFYVCKYCIHFSGFINWQTHRTMPYYNDMRGLVKMQLEKKIIISSMKKTEYNYCFKCKKDDYTRLFIRNREENSYEFVGYVCKRCRTCFFINTPYLKLRTLDYSAKSMGSFAVAIGEDEEKPIGEEYIIVQKTDISKLKKAKIPFRYNN